MTVTQVGPNVVSKPFAAAGCSPEPEKTGCEADAWRRRLPDLKSSRVLLRDLVDEDAPAIAAMMSDPQVSEFLPPGPASVENVLRFIAWAHLQREAGRLVSFAVVPSGQATAAGVFQLWPVSPAFETAEWGFALAPSCWGSGLFVDSARLVIDFAIDLLGVHRLEARAAIGNVRGHAALRKLGAVREGVLRQSIRCRDGIRDHLMWSILRDEWRARNMS